MYVGMYEYVNNICMGVFDFSAIFNEFSIIAPHFTSEESFRAKGYFEELVSSLMTIRQLMSFFKLESLVCLCHAQWNLLTSENLSITDCFCGSR